MFTLRQYLTALSDPSGLTRTLRDLEPCRDAAGRLRFAAGNSAAVFRVRVGGRLCALRCYFRPMRNLRAIYGERFLTAELFLHDTPTTGRWADVVLCDWIEGPTLEEAVAEAAGRADRRRLASLVAAFDRWAARSIPEPWAHGDLKPENLVVAPEGELRAIDLDAMFLPALAGQPSPELGTAAFQHPARRAEDFDARLDDYPAALISTALHLLALDPEAYARYGDRDGLLIDPAALPHDAAWCEARERFSRAGDAAHYRIAGLLTSPSGRLFGLAELFDCAVRYAAPARSDAGNSESAAAGPTCGVAGEETAVASDASCGTPVPELFARDGLWGYRTPSQTVIRPLYDCGFEFSEGLAAVRLGPTWHYIDTAGRLRLSCPGCEAVKPFRNGRAQVVRDGCRRWIDPTGREFDF